MKYLKFGLVLATAAIGVIPPVFGAAGDIKFDELPVTAIQNQVTYSEGGTKPLDTYLGFNLTGLKNDSSNTVNNVKIIFNASVTDTVELLTLYKPEVYLPASCTWNRDPATGKPIPSNPVQITCLVGQLKSQADFDPFTVFYRAPTKVVGGNGLGDVLGTDKVTTTWRLEYGEGTGGYPQSTPDNSVREVVQTLVTLGTTNPIDVKTALPKTDNKLTIFTGNKGYPGPNIFTGNTLTELRVFAEELTVPILAGTLSYGKSSIAIAPVNDAQCTNQGNFINCPDYTTAVVTQDNVEIIFSVLDPLTFSYRIDSSNLKKSPNQILGSVLVTYTGGQYVDEPVSSCPTSTLTPGLPCIKHKFCYKQNDPIRELRGDCEWQLENVKNALTRFR